MNNQPMATPDKINVPEIVKMPIAYRIQVVDNNNVPVWNGRWWDTLNSLMFDISNLVSQVDYWYKHIESKPK